ncbi:YHS domain-containing (seleno)protein [Rhodovulum sp. PH10]|uniref:YHS domain-containing (seleno)protein n=1 Tax=Rhodovulum sp. PH10 TaxID=1187851 RepID=UPI000A07A250|nr:YHS domain-containing (seleno)protein [Rhodovulum sp. PH10]
MTRPRQLPQTTLLRVVLLLVGAFLALSVGQAADVGAATTERVVTDRFTGIAIDGYDPVAYFVDKAPQLGRPEFEYSWAGVVWRFENEGNRAAFAQDPRVYAPVFGGYDPVGVARGISRPGNPLVFAVSEGRLLLFFSERAKAKFAADPDATMREARSHWPSVQAGLIP